jgi:hypothetical protein
MYSTKCVVRICSANNVANGFHSSTRTYLSVAWPLELAPRGIMTASEGDPGRWPIASARMVLVSARLDDESTWLLRDESAGLGDGGCTMMGQSLPEAATAASRASAGILGSRVISVSRFASG